MVVSLITSPHDRALPGSCLMPAPEFPSLALPCQLHRCVVTTQQGLRPPRLTAHSDFHREDSGEFMLCPATFSRFLSRCPLSTRAISRLCFSLLIALWVRGPPRISERFG